MKTTGFFLDFQQESYFLLIDDVARSAVLGFVEFYLLGRAIDVITETTASRTET